MQRNILDEVLSKEPTGLLYHYTRQSGLIGIIKNAEIWVTHTQYLNDFREYKHAVDLVRQQIEAYKAFNESTSKQILKYMEKALDGIDAMNVCVCSFSEEQDSLSQWRAYGASSSGFSIGFDGKNIKAIAEREGWHLAPCIYDPGTQARLVSELVKRVIEEIRDLEQVGDKEQEIELGGKLGFYMNLYAPILKDPSFSEEKEWRIISRPLSCKRENFDFREGNSMLIPYYRLNLGESPKDLGIHEIVVGPTPHPETSIRSTWSFLTKHALNKKVHVTASRVPYRSW
jgi:Protein of unknown function (DUF2971)